MKELTIEEKAKAYDEALERAKGVIEQNPLMEYLKKGIEYIFPELAKLDDEKIRKSLLDYLRTLPNHFSHNGGLVTDWIAWLEKPSEQKPVWSEEDEKEVAVLEAYLRSKDWNERHIDRALCIVDELVKKLKSLKDRYTWKPRDEQMSALDDVISSMDIKYDVLSELWKDLKKIKRL